jgi:hypothetical protein
MVDSVKNYGIAGVSTTLELGKQGAKIDASSSSVISLKDKDDALENVAIANGTDATHGVNKSQLDSISSTKYSKITQQVSYDSGTVAIGTTSISTRILKVTVEKDAGQGNWTGYNDATEITVGDSGDIDRIFAGFSPDGTQYTFDADHVYASGTTINAIVTQGGAGAGQATINVWYAGTIE